MAEAEAWPFSPDHFRRYDETDDARFYAQPRLVTHIDDDAIRAATGFYRERLPAGSRILDLMSSWVSHLPDSGIYAAVAGLGMSEAELKANPVLTERVVQDLNREPALPWDDGSFDGAVVTVSVQYLLRPVEVFAEVGRVLAPGAPFIVTFSNRCFPTKAVMLWQSLGDDDHARLVQTYFRLSGAFGEATPWDLSPNPGRTDPLFAVTANALPIEERTPPIFARS